MPKEMNAKNLSVFSDVIMSLASDAAAEVEGVEVLRSRDSSKRAIRGGGVSVYFLPNDKVAVDVFVNVNYPCRVPEAVAAVQLRVKEEIENATRFRVHSVNVQVVSVLFPTQTDI
ncbi:MAG TPA: Asp23/Gls24 family envelope stress response protein [Candidatus Limadaptatus stercorigallinarum]|uniref:Asp23/Gls24 family envelope stress response protein n=1 Tax=Candidatus Limadaptatus stercorigallinarum TaxID=2840845 RepID=A0A9D1L102_9FIRM|nr:Asp23/Gls24 family envelope stress response protein [Christensenellales bacterium]HIU20949.1 Asp23/Gls24 family envelope stress response protein [Candidatus Limadaptatus stercorigallinarum]